MPPRPYARNRPAAPLILRARPGNRLDKQAPWSAKLGGSYKRPQWPVKRDLDASWSPGIWVRVNQSQRVAIARHVNVNGSLAWTIAPGPRFNLSLGNLAPRTAHTIDEYEGRDGPLQLRKRMRKERSFTLRHDTTL